MKASRDTKSELKIYETRNGNFISFAALVSRCFVAD